MIYMGVDGGGTHLRATVLNEDILKKYSIESGVNLTATKEEDLKKTFEELKSKTGRVDYITLSFSGAGTQNRKDILKNIVKDVYEIENIIVYHDAEGMLYSDFKGKGVVVISGTGSVVFAKDDDNNLYRSGGWGHLFGDKCSGFWLCNRAIQKTFDYRDELVIKDDLYDLVKEYFKVDNIEDLTDIQKKSDFKTYIASFSKVMLSNITPAVEEIVKEGLDDLVPRCESMLKKVGSKKISAHGGVFKSEYFINEFKNRLKNYEVELSDEDVATKISFYTKELYERGDVK
ncbi:hypothetical protein OF820_09600 [Oceanotoga sp. DSM 15011]|uniref:BadF/BadG/BcrA/BcrD ATPase family protein n=1 Tax=Oceanotoga sp. DSM 15011 TaxID=2984951 RepID=UPI0021F49F7C|nr:BadF/BadG/BcrA/BcrD ATPase family protein [Oceanotoga sp. DSM 15011]UYO99319.1 hypothetical protein OF820_09600 [Oceanotoga sp. DSM 15011]